MRGLSAAQILPRTDPATRVGEILDRRLNRSSAAPLAVALSGGGDSVALTLIAADWARRVDRPLLVLTVDHGLNPDSSIWTRACAALATRLGAGFRPLAWTGDKPAAGLPAAARAARHRLLARAAREAGASVVLLGHTADDLAEAAAMRQAGSTTPDPREWAPSPAWPEGRGLFLLRPMLGLRRAELRAWLSARGEGWIEDPANDNPRFARARARAVLAGGGAATDATPVAGLADLARQVSDAHGLSLSRAALRAARFEAARALTGAACLCAAGTTRPPRGERLDRLTEALRGEADLVATLAGARIEADAETVRWLRTAGEIGRGGGVALNLAAGEAGVWDGRYVIATNHALRLQPLAGHAARLSATARSALATWPAAARGGLPAVMDDPVACPAVEPVAGVTLTALGLPRLLAACGAIEHEPG